MTRADAPVDPASTLATTDGAGHLPTLERPDHTDAALARWLEK